MLDKLEISSFISPSLVLDLAPLDKSVLLEKMADLIGKNTKVKDPAAMKKAIFLREKTMTTGIGEGIAIPHARTADVEDFVIAFARIKQGMDFEALDNKPVHLVFMIVANVNQDKKYIKLLSRLVLRLKSSSLIEQLMAAEDTDGLYRVLVDTK